MSPWIATAGSAASGPGPGWPKSGSGESAIGRDRTPQKAERSPRFQELDDFDSMVLKRLQAVDRCRPQSLLKFWGLDLSVTSFRAYIRFVKALPGPVAAPRALRLEKIKSGTSERARCPAGRPPGSRPERGEPRALAVAAPRSC